MIRGKGSPFEPKPKPFITKVEYTKILPTREDITDWIYSINKRLRKEKDKEKKRRLNVIKSEFIELRESI